jgi:hypothetical protein
VNALADREVGAYLTAHFVSSFQKVGTFRRAGGRKQGGNVASYFCAPGGQVLHVLAGPADAGTLLREARWVVETWKLAVLEKEGGAAQLAAVFRKAHADRLRQEHWRRVDELPLPRESASPMAVTALFDAPPWRALNRQGRVHLLLAMTSQVEPGQLYRVVFESILGEQVSTDPVIEAETAFR